MEKKVRRETTYQDLSPRSDRIFKLQKKLEKTSSLLKEGKYNSQKEMLSDLETFLSTEKEIQIQKSYLSLEEKFW